MVHWRVQYARTASRPWGVEAIVDAFKDFDVIVHWIAP
jgi:hypothetical protein